MRMYVPDARTRTHILTHTRTHTPPSLALAAAGGLYSANDTSSRECWFANINTQAACIPPAQCPSPFYSALDNSVSCPEYCLLPALNVTSCSCASLPRHDRRLCDAYGLQWVTQPVTGCALRSIMGGSRILSDCPALGGTYFRGGVWYNGKVNTETACELSGTCSSAGASSQVRVVFHMQRRIYTQTQMQTEQAC